MERGDIVGGLKSALARGESLNHAMMTLINAGYRREDVDLAAKSLHEVKQPMNIVPKETKPMPEPEIPKRIQKVSNYGQCQNRFDVAIMIILVFILIALIGILAGVLFFRENMAAVFNNLFGNG